MFTAVSGSNVNKASLHVFTFLLVTAVRLIYSCFIPCVFHTRVTEINTYNMWYFPQHVLLCTSTVHDQSGDICIQGYLRIIWIGNTKSLKIDNIHKHYVLCLKLEYFFTRCKT